jgi:hypothetical protein
MERIYRHGLFVLFGAGLFLTGLLLERDAKGSASSGTVAGQTLDATQTAVLSAAQAQLKALLDSIPQGMEENYGFATRDDFANAQLVQPYEMFAVDGTGSIAALDVWRVPIVVANRFCALITVSKSGDSYAIAAIGAAPLANELGQMESYTTSGQVVRTTRHKSILRAVNHGADFVVYDLDPRQAVNTNQLRVRPLRSAMSSLFSKAAHLRAAGKTIGAPIGSSRSDELTMGDVQSLLSD